MPLTIGTLRGTASKIGKKAKAKPTARQIAVRKRLAQGNLTPAMRKKIGATVGGRRKVAAAKRSTSGGAIGSAIRTAAKKAAPSIRKSRGSSSGTLASKASSKLGRRSNIGPARPASSRRRTPTAPRRRR